MIPLRSVQVREHSVEFHTNLCKIRKYYFPANSITAPVCFINETNISMNNSYNSDEHYKEYWQIVVYAV